MFTEDVCCSANVWSIHMHKSHSKRYETKRNISESSHGRNRNFTFHFVIVFSNRLGPWGVLLWKCLQPNHLGTNMSLWQLYLRLQLNRRMRNFLHIHQQVANSS